LDNKIPSRVSEDKEFGGSPSTHIEHTAAFKKKPVRGSAGLERRQPYLNSDRNGKGLSKTIPDGKFEKWFSFQMLMIGDDRLLKCERREKGHTAL
jgi:hypothetical protein